MDDLISRQAAIDALNEQIEQCNKALGSFDISLKDEFAIKVERASLKAYREQLVNLPTVQPKRGKWIPVGERLPEENGQYLITVKYKHVDGYDDIYAEHGEWNDGKWDMFCFGHCGEVDGIIAWMPLPEPYMEGGAE